MPASPLSSGPSRKPFSSRQGLHHVFRFEVLREAADRRGFVVVDFEHRIELGDL
jgi:hypothetical protein